MNENQTTHTIDTAVAFLNTINGIDSNALNELIEKRAKCNPELTQHPTLQIHGQDDDTSLGVLGLLNGLFTDNGYVIAAVYNSQNKLSHFEKRKL